MAERAPLGGEHLTDQATLICGQVVRTALGKYMRRQGCGGAHGLEKVVNIGVGKINV